MRASVLATDARSVLAASLADKGLGPGIVPCISIGRISRHGCGPWSHDSHHRQSCRQSCRLAVLESPSAVRSHESHGVKIVTSHGVTESRVTESRESRWSPSAVLEQHIATMRQPLTHGMPAALARRVCDAGLSRTEHNLTQLNDTEAEKLKSRIQMTRSCLSLHSRDAPPQHTNNA
jgi:hypothetical protein